MNILFICQISWYCLLLPYNSFYARNFCVRAVYMQGPSVFVCFQKCSLIRPTQSIMHVPLQVNRSQKCILLNVQYKYLKSCCGDFDAPESDPPHKIMRYWVYYSTQLCFRVPLDRICQVEMICIGSVPVLKRHSGGAGP